jgi:murein DD-endopeptidase MepM/ murein hydrolase activator NlpD
MPSALPGLILAVLLAFTLRSYAEDGPAPSEKIQYAPTRSADGFDMPVGKPNAEGYYRSRGLIVGRHMGDDWNGDGGGNTDLGAPVYSTAHGLVVYAKDARMGWGKLVIIRHAYWENRRWNYVDSLYAHLHQIFVREGQQVRRGQLVGTIGTNRGMYTAHLHFEIRKNLRIGINQGSYRKDLSNYYKPYDFITADEGKRRPGKQQGGDRRVSVPINTFRLQARVVDTMGSSASAPRERSVERPAPSAPRETKKGDYRVFRYD